MYTQVQFITTVFPVPLLNVTFPLYSNPQQHWQGCVKPKSLMCMQQRRFANEGPTGAIGHLLFLAGAGLLPPCTAGGKDPCKARTFPSSSVCYRGCSSCSAFHTLQIFVSSCITRWSKSIPSCYLFSPSPVTRSLWTSNLTAGLWLNQGRVLLPPS